ncbi:MAG TPA: tetratricopeptide repeat protein [Pirellulaceae bacterium]
MLNVRGAESQAPFDSRSHQRSLPAWADRKMMSGTSTNECDCQPTRSWSAHAGWAWVLILAATESWAQGGLDTVQLLDGTTVRGRVTKVSPESVLLEAKESPRTLSVVEIRRIRFADDPALLRQARDAIYDDRPEQAVTTLERVNGAEIENTIVRQDLEFHKAFALARVALDRGSGEADAARALLAFDRENPESFHAYTVAETLGVLALRLGKPEAALPYFGRLAASRVDSIQVRGRVREADCLRMVGGDKIPEALARYESVLAVPVTGSSGNRIKQLATVGKARCEAELGRADDAIPALERVVAENDVQDQELFAAAYNALGTCHRQGQHVDEALLAYLHVDLLFHSDPDAHAEALYFLSELFAARGQGDRAADAKSRLRTRYGNSTWARKSS